MITCKDCIHYDVCGFNEYKDFNEICSFFKDKSRIVELPCEIGTKLFLIDYPMAHHRLKRYEITGTRVVMVIECFESQSICKRLVDVHFGKTVFLTKDEAEAKLKEINNEC